MRRLLVLVMALLLAACSSAPAEPSAEELDEMVEELSAQLEEDLANGPDAATGTTIGAWPATSVPPEPVDAAGFRADRAGTLPGKGRATVGGVELPSGHVEAGALWV